MGNQGGTHLSIGADPSDDNVVYIGGDRQPWGNEPTRIPFTWPNSLNANNFTGRLFRIDDNGLKSINGKGYIGLMLFFHPNQRFEHWEPQKRTLLIFDFV